MFKFKRRRRKIKGRQTISKKIRESKWILDKASIPTGQYAFPFSLKLPDSKALPSSLDFNDGENIYKVDWTLSFAFNKKFFESPLEITRKLRLQF